MTRLKAMLAGVFFATLTGFFVWWLGPPLLSDFQHRNNRFEPAREIHVTEARCRSKLFVISFCDIKVAGPGLPGGRQELNYLIFGGVGEETVSPQRSAGPAPAGGYLTTRIGMDHLANRIVSFGVAIAFLLAITVGGLIGMFKRRTA